jgi:hypothetical protein
MLRRAPSSQKLYSVVYHIIYLAIALACFAIAVSLVVTNIHKFHTALAVRRKAVLDNRWLLEQCRSAEFYSNMRQHSALCDEVALEEADTLWLHALRDVFDTSNPCGSTSCEQRIVNGLAWVFERGVFVLCAMALSVFILTMAVFNTHRVLAQRQLGSAAYPHEAMYAPFYPRTIASDVYNNNLADGLCQRRQRQRIGDT